MNVPVDPESLEAIGARSSWSDAVCIGPFVWVTGQLGSNKCTGGLAEGIEAQAGLALENVKDVPKHAGATMADAVSVRV
ncbi:MAG: hypothetical protein JO243_14395 [Solirubrobacterales bacterium]|nr:hypothetical protein [Solirubrobacterales bacterium]